MTSLSYSLKRAVECWYCWYWLFCTFIPKLCIQGWCNLFVTSLAAYCPQFKMNCPFLCITLIYFFLWVLIGSYFNWLQLSFGSKVMTPLWEKSQTILFQPELSQFASYLHHICIMVEFIAIAKKTERRETTSVTTFCSYLTLLTLLWVRESSQDENEDDIYYSKDVLHIHQTISGMSVILKWEKTTILTFQVVLFSVPLSKRQG